LRLSLRSFEFPISSIESLRLGDPNRLVDLRDAVAELGSSATVRFFGAGDRLKPITSVASVAKEFRKHKAESYSFADVRNLATEDARVCRSVGIRRALLTVRATIEAQQSDIPARAADLLAVDRLLLSRVEYAKIDVPFSFLDVPDATFRPPAPPRFFGKLSDRSVVDVIYLGSDLDDSDRALAEALKNARLPGRAERVVEDDLLIVRWAGPSGHSIEEALNQRYAWYTEHAGLPVDAAYNEHGDHEYSLFDARPVDGLTSYSAFERKAMKSIVFDSPEDIRDVLEGLRQMLESGATLEGEPLVKVTVVVPTRVLARTRLRCA
jgi:hypothetical protein